MSIHLVSDIWRNPTAWPYSGSELHVLLRLADYSNEDGYSWPSIDTIAKETRLSRSAVIRAKRTLIDDGRLAQERHGNQLVFHLISAVADCDMSQIATGADLLPARSQISTSAVTIGPTNDPPIQEGADLNGMPAHLSRAHSARRSASGQAKSSAKARTKPGTREVVQKEPFVSRQAQQVDMFERGIRGEL